MAGTDETDDTEIDERVTVNPDGSVTYALSAPAASEGKTLDSVTLRRVKPADLAAADAIKGDTARNILLISRLGDIPQATVKNLDGYDYSRLNGIVIDFLQKPKASATGGSSSSRSGDTAISG